jgi:hypothetical protein
MLMQRTKIVIHKYPMTNGAIQTEKWIILENIKLCSVERAGWKLSKSGRFVTLRDIDELCHRQGSSSGELWA